jgi:fumarylacetoacetate (FAA) hydrolase family protein
VLQTSDSWNEGRVAPQLGNPVNRIRTSDECEPWAFGIGTLMRNLAKQRIL